MATAYLKAMMEVYGKTFAGLDPYATLYMNFVY